MENNEDIKIVEELKKVEERISKNQVFAKEDRNTAIKRIKAIENLLSRLKTAERMNDVLAEQVNQQNDILYDFDSSISYLPCNTDVPMNKCLKNECVQCIKEWARKKVEDESNISRL